MKISNFPISQKIILLIIALTVLLSSMITFKISQAAFLTENQISAIITLLQSFGSDQSTINKVRAALTGNTYLENNYSKTNRSGSLCPKLHRNLYLGVTGQDVSGLQAFLKKHGYFTHHEITDYFGAQTARAVRAFQCATLSICSGSEKLNGYGVVGPKTRAKIREYCNMQSSSVVITEKVGSQTQQFVIQKDMAENPNPNINRNLYLGTRGYDVSELQAFLKRLGYFSYPEITGYYGNATKQAVQKFQCDILNICDGNEITTGYGIVGPQTRKAILSYRSTEISMNTDNIYSGQTSNVVPSSPGACSISGITMKNGESRFFYLYDKSTNCDTVKQTRVCKDGVLSGDPGYSYLTCQTIGRSRGSNSSGRGSVSYKSCTFNGKKLAHGESITAYQSATVPYGESCKSETRTCNNGVLLGSYVFDSCASQHSVFNYTNHLITNSLDVYNRNQKVILSLPMSNLSQGDVILVYAIVEPKIEHEYNTMFSSRLILAENQNALSGSEITEMNGYNLTPVQMQKYKTFVGLHKVTPYDLHENRKYINMIAWSASTQSRPGDVVDIRKASIYASVIKGSDSDLIYYNSGNSSELISRLPVHIDYTYSADKCYKVFESGNINIYEYIFQKNSSLLALSEFELTTPYLGYNLSVLTNLRNASKDISEAKGAVMYDAQHHEVFTLIGGENQIKENPNIKVCAYARSNKSSNDDSLVVENDYGRLSVIVAPENIIKYVDTGNNSEHVREVGEDYSVVFSKSVDNVKKGDTLFISALPSIKNTNTQTIKLHGKILISNYNDELVAKSREWIVEIPKGHYNPHMPIVYAYKLDEDEQSLRIQALFKISGSDDVNPVPVYLDYGRLNVLFVK